jgi:glycosyltransferase involved in cell wall biosynthesis
MPAGVHAGRKLAAQAGGSPVRARRAAHAASCPSTEEVPTTMAADLGISICIPTHHGRAPLLAEALDSIGAQLSDLDDPVEICVSDNASRDGTDVVIDRFRGSHPDLRVVYSRNGRDLGVGRNIMRAAELASEDWCWFFGSDDQVADGGVERVLAALERFDDANGLSMAKANFTADMATRGELDVPAFFPTSREPTLYHGFDQILSELTFQQCFLSSTVDRRDRWAAAVRDVRDRALAHRHFPQIYVFGEMVRREPAWAWLPDMIVKARAGTPYLVEHHRRGPDLARMHAELLSGIDAVIGELAGRGTAVHRAVMERAYEVLASPRIVRIIKERPNHRISGDALMLVTFVRALWWHPGFRRDCLPLLLAPGAALRAWDRRRSSAEAQSPPIPRQAASTRVSAEVPAVMLRGWMEHLPCTVENQGSATLRSTGEHPVSLAYRWFADSDAKPLLVGFRDAFPAPLEPGRSQSVTCRLLVPFETGEYVLRISPVQEHVAWFDDLDRANGLAARVRVVNPG